MRHTDFVVVLKRCRACTTLILSYDDDDDDDDTRALYQNG